MPKKYIPRDYTEVLKEALGQNDRSAISVGTSLVDYALEQYIASQLRSPRNAKERSQLFTEDGIFGTFSQRIIGTYFMRLIGPITQRNLHLIRDIRNQVSHDMNPVSFSGTEEIRSRCELLVLEDVESVYRNLSKGGPDTKFKMTIQFYMSIMLDRGNPLAIPTTGTVALDN